jgi:hypothetical protein
VPSPRRDSSRRTTRAGQLLDRVIQQRRSTRREPASQSGEADIEQRIGVLEERIEYLEALLLGLQDSVHREVARQGEEIEALKAKTQAPEVARALGRYSRERGF